MSTTHANGSVLDLTDAVSFLRVQSGHELQELAGVGPFEQVTRSMDAAGEPEGAPWISPRDAEILIRTMRAIGGERTLAERCERVLDAVAEVLATGDVGLALVDPAGQALAIAAARGPALATGWKPSPLGEGLVGVVARSGRPLRIDNLAMDPRVGRDEFGVGQGNSSWLGVPLTDPTGTFGVLVATSGRPGAFHSRDERVLGELAGLVGASLRDARALDAATRERKRLRQREERLRDCAEATADWLWEQDEQCRYTRVTPSRPDRAGQPAPLPVGKTLREAEPRGVGEEQWGQHEADLQARRLFRDFRLARLDSRGGMRTLSLSGKPIFDAEGAFRGYRGSAADVTVECQPTAGAPNMGRTLANQARLETSLAAGARQQAVLADLAQFALTVGDGSQFLEATCAAVAEVLDADFAHVLRLLPDGETLLLEQGVGWRDGLVGVATVELGAGSHAARALALGEPLIVEDLEAEQRFRPMALLGEHDVTGGALVAIPGAGAPYGLLGVHARRSITFSEADAQFLRGVASVVAAAVDLRRADRLLDIFVDSALEPVAQFDSSMRCTSANAAIAVATGLAADAMRGRTMREMGILAPAQLDIWEGMLRSIFRSGREREAELCLTTPRGERWYQMRLVPRPDGGRELHSVILLARDLNDLRRAEEERTALQRELLECQRRLQNLFDQVQSEQRGRSRRTDDAELIAAQLTPRELEILGMVAAGFTNRQIAARLHLTPGTVRNHLGRVFPKLDAADRTQAAVRAADLGLIDVDHEADAGVLVTGAART